MFIYYLDKTCANYKEHESFLKNNTHCCVVLLGSHQYVLHIEFLQFADVQVDAILDLLVYLWSE